MKLLLWVLAAGVPREPRMGRSLRRECMRRAAHVVKHLYYSLLCIYKDNEHLLMYLMDIVAPCTPRTGCVL